MRTFSCPALLSYGLFGLPLALVALPIYVYVPQFYAARFGLSLALIGTGLLVMRTLDAFIDPAIGQWIDRRRHSAGYRRVILLSLPLLACGFLALFHPPQEISPQPFVWFSLSLLPVYLGFSLATIAYQSWGATLTQERSQRSRLTAVREACGLAGVVIAAALPGFVDIGWLSLVFIVSLVTTAALLLLRAPQPGPPQHFHEISTALLAPLRNFRFRWLFAVFMVNGIAAAIPATLFLFFANDRLALPQYAGLFLVLYFIAAALSMPIWVGLAKRHGEQRAWLVSMCLSIAVFVWTYTLASGAGTGFALICILSGFSLGADLVLPPALLAAVIGKAGHIGSHEGAYFGLWSWATKMNLALAAGISLPLLERLGYVPGTTDAQGLQALAAAYALLPCLLKASAAALLWRSPLNNL